MFVKDMALRIGLAVFAMICAGIGSAIGQSADSDWSRAGGALLGLVIGALLAVRGYRVLSRRR